MTRKSDGGPAFPTNGEDWQPGMTLRDWFAGQALVGLLAGSPDADCGPSGYANDAYSMADAMLKMKGRDNGPR